MAPARNTLTTAIAKNQVKQVAIAQAWAKQGGAAAAAKEAAKKQPLKEGSLMTIATWNMARISKMQLQLLDVLGYDVVFLSEVWDTAADLVDYGGTNRLITGPRPDPKKDPAGAVAFRLSEKAAASLDTWGTILVFIGVYVPPDTKTEAWPGGEANVNPGTSLLPIPDFYFAHRFIGRSQLAMNYQWSTAHGDGVHDMVNPPRALSDEQRTQKIFFGPVTGDGHGDHGPTDNPPGIGPEFDWSTNATLFWPGLPTNTSVPWNSAETRSGNMDPLPT